MNKASQRPKEKADMLDKNGYYAEMYLAGQA
jgi:hypothetical protein